MSTMEEDAFASELPNVAAILSGVWILMIILISCVGNGAVLVTSLRKRRNLKALDLLTINLAVSDLTVCLIGYPLPAVSGFADRWMFGESGCIWYGFCGFFFPMNAMMTLVAIAVCRYLKLCKKNFDDTLLAKHMPKIIAAVWMYALVWTVPPLMGWSRYVPERFRTSCTVDWASRLPSDQAYIICIFIFCYLFPLMCLIGCYGAITKAIFAHRRMILQQHTTHFTHFWTEVRLIKSSFSVTLAYMIAWTPYAVISFWAFAGDASSLPVAVSALPVFLAKSAAVYNPIIYTIFNRKFKSELQEMCCCCGCKCYNISININTTITPQQEGVLPVATGTAERSRLVFYNPFSKFLIASPSMTHPVHKVGTHKRLFVTTKKASIPAEPANPLGMVIHQEISNPFPCIPEDDMPGPSRGFSSGERRGTLTITMPLVHLPNVISSASSVSGVINDAYDPASAAQNFNPRKRGSL
ncbi:opsin-5-like [Patiria miniata]|uniref:G-protein coupled receptors family 1 profile domain-containing protein n=1 Tax=Patiria miniata TaxID=46514 RepID=A0A913Z9E2_PATMI|nr:opsin-5-like [Patiria miniata]